MRCKRSYYDRQGRGRWSGGDVVRQLERAKGPLSLEQILASLGDSPAVRNGLREAIARGDVAALPGGLYKATMAHAPPYDSVAASKCGNSPRTSPAHARHVRRHRPGVKAPPMILEDAMIGACAGIEAALRRQMKAWPALSVEVYPEGEPPDVRISVRIALGARDRVVSVRVDLAKDPAEEAVILMRDCAKAAAGLVLEAMGRPGALVKRRSPW